MTSKKYPTVTVSARELVNVLKAMLPFSGNDPTLPSVYGVHLMRDSGGRITVGATNRFVGAITSIPAEFDVTGEWEVVVPPPMCKKIITDWKSVSAAYPMQLTVAVDPATSTIVVSDTHGVAHSHPFNAQTGKAANLIENAKKAEQSEARTSGVQAFNFDYLTKFQHLQRCKGENVAIHWSAKNVAPAFVTVGDHSVGIVMPIRYPEDGEPRTTVDSVLAGGAQ